MSAAVPAPFVARWETTSSSADRLEARLALNQSELFQGHYPGEPILPGTYLLEALVQAARAHLASSRLRLGEIGTCRFRAPLRPGARVDATLEFQVQPAGAVRVTATAGSAGEEAASATLLLVNDDPPDEPDPEPGPERAGRHLDQTLIRKVLPHRFPALLVDSARFVGADGSGEPLLVAFKAVSCNEPCYAGPGDAPLESWRYPEALVAESFCQACGLLRSQTQAPGAQAASEGMIPVVARLNGVRFFAGVAPGECLEHRVRLVASPLGGAMFAGETRAAGRLVVRVERVVAVMARGR